MKRLFRNRDIKVIILEVFLIALGLVGLTLGVKYIMNSINVNVDTSKLAIDSMNANVTNGTLMPINDSTVNINTTSNVLRITFDVKGASTNTGSNIIYDVLLNLTADCSLKNESVKWNLYKNNNLLTSGSTSPKYDKDVLKGKIMLTDIQQDLVPYSKTADKYVFILWMSESCNEEDITKCDISKGLTSDSGGKSISGNIDIRLNSGKKKENKRESIEGNACEVIKGTYIVEHLDDGSTGDSGSGVYKVIHDAIAGSNSATGSTIPASTDYRYYGASPNNYICLDMEGSSICPDKHLYRIIGSIYEENAGTNLLKVMKATPLTDGTTSKFSWDCGVTSQGFLYSNNWSTSSLDILLSKWLSGKASNYYNGSTTSISVDFTNYSPSDKAKQFINNSKWYLGGHSTSTGVTTEQFYTFERGNKTYSRNSLHLNKKIGLMYPSDYGYASGKLCSDSIPVYSYNDSCKDRNWIFNNLNQWFITSRSDTGSLAFYLNGTGTVLTFAQPLGGVAIPRSVRPTFYLTSTTSIISGTGSIDDPYLIDN